MGDPFLPNNRAQPLIEPIVPPQILPTHATVSSLFNWNRERDGIRGWFLHFLILGRLKRFLVSLYAQSNYIGRWIILQNRKKEVLLHNLA